MHALSEDTRETPTSIISERLSRIVRTTQRVQAQLNARSDGEWEWTANRLIGTLVRSGPMRLTALAAESGCELSTVSRQVASLVGSGYVERQPDPADGRAFLLAATELAQARYSEHVRIRDAEVTRMLAGWSERDLCQLATLLTRLNNDLDQHQWRLPADKLVAVTHHNKITSTNIDTEQDSI